MKYIELQKNEGFSENNEANKQEMQDLYLSL